MSYFRRPAADVDQLWPNIGHSLDNAGRCWLLISPTSTGDEPTLAFDFGKSLALSKLSAAAQRQLQNGSPESFSRMCQLTSNLVSGGPSAERPGEHGSPISSRHPHRAAEVLLRHIACILQRVWLRGVGVFLTRSETYAALFMEITSSSLGATRSSPTLRSTWAASSRRRWQRQGQQTATKSVYSRGRPLGRRTESTTKATTDMQTGLSTTQE